MTIIKNTGCLAIAFLMFACHQNDTLLPAGWLSQLVIISLIQGKSLSKAFIYFLLKVNRL